MVSNRIKSAQLKMLDAVIAVFKDKTALLDQRPAVKKDLAELTAIREDIATQLKAVKPNGQNTADRELLRDKLRGSCAVYAAYMTRIGRETNNNFLVDTFSNTSTKCKTDEGMISFAETLIDNANDNLTLLAEVGVVEADIDAVQDDLDELKSVKGMIDLVNKTNTAFSAEADKYLTKALASLRDKLDISMNSLRELDAELFLSYQVARQVNKPQTTSTRLVITVKDAITKQPIVNAYASVPFLNKPVKSDSNGVIVIKTGKKSEFTVKVTKAAYSEASFYIDSIKITETRTVEVLLNVLGLPSGG